MLQSKRFLIVLIGYTGLLLSAWGRHWFPGISETILGIAAGLITAFLGAESWRKSNHENK